MAQALRVERHITELRRYARALLGSHADADELVQETLLRALSRQHFWTHIRDLRAYLFSILHNAYIDRVNRLRRAETDLDSVLPSLAQAPAQLASIELSDLVRAVKSLPAEQREVVLLVGVHGMSYQKTAAILDVPIGTVMSRLSRGRAALYRMTEGSAPASGQRASLDNHSDIN